MNLSPNGRDYSGNEGLDEDDVVKVGSREWYAIIHMILPDNFDTLPQKEKSRLVTAAEIAKQSGRARSHPG